MKNVPELRFPEFEGEWKVIKIGEIFEFVKTNSFSRNQLNYNKGTYHNIHYGDIHMHFPSVLNLDNNELPFVNEDLESKINSAELCKEGDLIFADASEDYDYIGKATELKNVKGKKIVSGLHTIVARDEKGVLVNGFKGYISNSNNVHHQIKVMANGAKVLGISKGSIKKVEIPMPTKKEQTKIANFFSLIDEKIEKQDQKVEDLEEMKKGLMQRIFNQDIRFKDENGEAFPEWEEKKIGDVFNIKAAGDLNRNNLKNIKTEKCRYPVYGNALTKKGLLGYFSDYKYSPEAITVTARGELGKAFYRNDKFTPVGRLLTLKSKSDDISYFFYSLILDSINIFNEYTGVPQLTAPALANYKVEVPTLLKEQRKIADFLSSFDRKIDKEREKLKSLKEMKKGLMQKIFL